MVPTRTAATRRRMPGLMPVLLVWLPGIGWHCAPSVDPVGALQFAHIRNNRAEFSICQALFDGGHVAEPPVMRSDSVPCRQNERHVPVMRWLVYAVDKRRRDAVLPCGILAVAGGADGVEICLSLTGLCRKYGRTPPWPLPIPDPDSRPAGHPGLSRTKPPDPSQSAPRLIAACQAFPDGKLKQKAGSCQEGIRRLS